MPPIIKSLKIKGLLTISLTLALISILNAQQVRQIEILNADVTLFDNTSEVQISRLIGNVQFQHEDIMMNCDSAHYFPATNTLDAFSNVHLWREDTLQLYGDFLRYKGNERLATVRRNVVLIDNETTLKTNFIDYDLNKDEGIYLNGGSIENGNNLINSKTGHYFASEKLMFFRDSVVVTNPEYVIYCDTLKYNTLTETAYFFGPTRIISDENTIYCENGWYDTRNNVSRFSKNAWLHTENRFLQGDSLYYERDTGFGEALNNVMLVDSAQNVVLFGNHAIYHEKTGDAMMTRRAFMVQVNNADSLFIHADTLRVVEDTIPDHRIIKAYRHVKIFRHDIQGKCDSLIYKDSDSAFHFFGEPVLWSEDNQLTAEFIVIHTDNNNLSRIDMTNSAFIISMEDSTKFNQVKGRDMEGFFADNELVRIEVNGNGETLYFAREGDEIIGANKAASSNLVIYMVERTIDRILFLTNPDAKYIPIEKLSASAERLENFRWYGSYRPLVREDIFIWRNDDIPELLPNEIPAVNPDRENLMERGRGRGRGNVRNNRDIR